MDGLRAQAGKACGPECLPAWGRERSLLARRRRDRSAAECEVRDHARYRHAVAARLGAAVCRRDGASAEPCAFRRRRQARWQRAGNRRVRDTAAAREHQPARREPLVVRAPARGRPWHRPLHARGFRRLPGRVPRGLLHRQGNLRRRCIRAGPERSLSRESDPEPRPARGLLRAIRVVERRAIVRGVPVDLCRGHPTPASLDSRRLATGGMAAAARARPRQAPPEKSVVDAFAVEAVRQPATQFRPGGVDSAAAARMGRPSACLAMDPDRDRDPGASAGECVRPGLVAEAGRSAAASALRRHHEHGRPARGPDGADTCLPPVRGDGQRRRDRTHRVADAGRTSTAARMESVSRRRTGSRLGRHNQPRRTCRVVQNDVDRPGHRGRNRDPVERICAILPGGSRADRFPVVRLARNRLVDQPAARPPRTAADEGPDALPPESRA